MPIRPYLDAEVFEQDDIDTMSRALADACRELGLRDQEGDVQLLALRIIERAREGILDPIRLKTAATEGFRAARGH